MRRHRTELIDYALEARDVRELFAGVSDRLKRIVPFDAAVWMGTDPATTLPTAPARTENLGHVCRGEGAALRVWELEYRGEDVNLYRDLAHAERPAGALRLTTGDRPARSARYRELIRPNGYEDELRLVLKADGELLSINDEAQAWLDDLEPDAMVPDALRVMPPMVAAGALESARAIATERERGTARARLRSRSGRWLLCHATCLRDAAGELGDTALVIEAAPASEIAPLIVAAYDLSPREQQITQLIAHGFGTAEMAECLHLSSHTVRDYVKVIFEKVGVSSRGELVATLFAEHFAPVYLDPATHERVGH